NPEAKTAMEDAGRRMFSMMVIYEKLYRSEDFRTVSSAEYLSQLLDMIREQFSTPGVRVERELADFPLDSSVLFPLGMILNELITNAFKYAFVGKGSGTIRVSLRCDDRGSAKLLVLDDGVGLPSEYLSEGTGGFGSMMIRALTDQIQGTVHASSENGARIAVSFPIVSSCIES
ncbi:MAG: sensor histidine kinase, partial [Spirochaetales bacterium]|nr:sensor histidine kinase [Spirochaetales bacterium]